MERALDSDVQLKEQDVRNIKQDVSDMMTDLEISKEDVKNIELSYANHHQNVIEKDMNSLKQGKNILIHV